MKTDMTGRVKSIDKLLPDGAIKTEMLKLAHRGVDISAYRSSGGGHLNLWLAGERVEYTQENVNIIFGKLVQLTIRADVTDAMGDTPIADLSEEYPLPPGTVID